MNSTACLSLIVFALVMVVAVIDIYRLKCKIDEVRNEINKLKFNIEYERSLKMCSELKEEADE